MNMKVAALISVVVLLIALGVIVGTDAHNAHISISERAASRRWSYLVFAGSLSVFGSLLFIYLLAFFGDKLGLPASYYIALFAGWICLLLTAWIPDHGPRDFSNIHWKTAFGLACSMTVMTMSIATAQHVGETIRILSIVTSLWYCYTLYFWLFNTQSFQLYLRFETMNIASFMGLLALTVIFR